MTSDTPPPRQSLPDDILAEYDRAIRARPFTNDPAVTFEWDGPVFRFTGLDPAPHWNGVAFADLTGTDPEPVIARQVAHFAALGHAFEWKAFSHDCLNGDDEVLRTAGFQPEEPEGFAVLDLDGLGSDRPLPAGIALRRLAKAGDLDPIVGLITEVYGTPDHGGALVTDLKRELAHDPDTLSVYGAFSGETMVSCGWIRFHGGSRFASLWGGATLPDWRGQGLYSALVRHRGTEAKARGFQWLTVDCSPQSRPILEHNGFKVLAMITPWIWTPNP